MKGPHEIGLPRCVDGPPPNIFRRYSRPPSVPVAIVGSKYIVAQRPKGERRVNLGPVYVADRGQQCLKPSQLGGIANDE